MGKELKLAVGRTLDHVSFNTLVEDAATEVQISESGVRKTFQNGN